MIPIKIKIALGFDSDTADEIVNLEWQKRINSICKPCWELKYCPYGTLVEDFPLPSIPFKEALEHNNYLKKCLETGLLKDGELLDDAKKEIFKKMIDSFNPDDYPEKVSKFEAESMCTVFCHLCPVFFVNEPLTETKEMRRIGRYIPRKTIIRVARRDNYTCQICGKQLLDNEIEFDHIIPLSKGGSSEENNIRVTCFKCNRSKSNKIDI